MASWPYAARASMRLLVSVGPPGPPTALCAPYWTALTGPRWSGFSAAMRPGWAQAKWAMMRHPCRIGAASTSPHGLSRPAIHDGYGQCRLGISKGGKPVRCQRLYSETVFSAAVRGKNGGVVKQDLNRVEAVQGSRKQFRRILATLAYLLLFQCGLIEFNTFLRCAASFFYRFLLQRSINAA